MSRTSDPITTPAPMPVLLPATEANIEAAQDASVLLQGEVEQLATQLGYEGHLSVGTLEDEIRFFQRRTVEALLETGKRLLILQKLTPHGEFLQRLELLGFAKQTAYRFMAAAQKVSKSIKLGLLAGQTKNGSAFLELITHDDDVIKNLSSMDKFDTMSASQLRTAARNMVAEKTAVEKVLEFKNKQIDKLQLVQALPPDEQLPELQKTATGMMHETLGQIRGKLRQAFLALNDHPSATDNSVFMAGLLGQIQREVNALRTEYNLPDVSSAEEQAVMAAAAQWAIKKS